MQAEVQIVISGRARDLGGFHVKRVLPFAKRRMVGPFAFFDAMGPEVLGPGQGVDVRPHPHIGLSTVTYLFAGELVHRDSLGSVQAIRPGEVNWMTAGKGIAHSERTAPEQRGREKSLFGIQVWVAHPRANEECDPAFYHHGAGELPVIGDGGWSARIILGDFDGARSPVRTLSPTLYAELTVDAGCPLPDAYEERAIYVVDGALAIGEQVFAPGEMAVVGRGDLRLASVGGPAKCMLIGGDRLDGERFIEWNFVSSSKERIEQAKADWAAQRFPKIPGDDQEYIPLPPRPIAPVNYP